MTVLDALFLGVVSVAAIRGAQRGMVTEAMASISVVVGLAAAFVAAPALTDLLFEWTGDDGSAALLELASFAIVFILTFAAIRAIGGLLARFSMRGATGVLNRAGGSLIGAVKWSVVLAFGLICVDAFGPTSLRIGDGQDSVLAQPLRESAMRMFAVPTQPGVPDDG